MIVNKNFERKHQQRPQRFVDDELDYRQKLYPETMRFKQEGPWEVKHETVKKREIKEQIKFEGK